MFFDFDATGITPNMGGFDPIPAGDYTVILTKANERQNRSGSGSHTEMFFDVLEGPCKGRQVVDRLNMGNFDPNTKAKAQGRLSALCHAIGKLRIRGIMDLANIPLVITVAVREIKDLNPNPNGSRPPRLVNEVTNYKKYAPPQGGNPPQKPAPGGNPNNMPWGQ